MSALDLSAAKALAARAIAAALADANTAEAVSGTASNDQEMLDDKSEAAFNDDDPMVIEEAVAGELTSNSSREVFVAYLEEKHPLLMTLFPADVTVVDLFDQVEQKKSIDAFFDETSEPAAKRAFRRLENEIGQRLKEEIHLGLLNVRREKHAVAVTKSKNRKRKWTQPEEPEALPTMSLEEAASTKLLAAHEKAKVQREKVLEKGFLFKGMPPKEQPKGQEHIVYFRNAPRTVIESFGAELVSNPANLEAFGVEVKFNREALLRFEDIKRAGNPNAKGKDRLKHSNFSLPTSGATVDWSDFFNVLLGWAYRKGGAAEFKAVIDGTKESLEAGQEAAVAKEEGKYDAKLNALTQKISKADLEHVQAPAGPKKEGLKAQLDAHRAARDGLLTEKAEKVEAIEARYERMLEVRAEMDARAAALKAKAAAAVEALHTRAAPAAGTSAEDGAAALESTRAAALAAEHARAAAQAAAQAPTEAEGEAGETAAFNAELDDF